MRSIFLILLLLVSLTACSTKESNTLPSLEDPIALQEYYAELERQGDLKLAEHDKFCARQPKHPDCQSMVAPGMEWLLE